MPRPRSYVKPHLTAPNPGASLSPFSAKPVVSTTSRAEEVALATSYVKRKCDDASVILARLGVGA